MLGGGGSSLLSTARCRCSSTRLGAVVDSCKTWAEETLPTLEKTPTIDGWRVLVLHNHRSLFASS